jgi:membrane protein DedA with SNARE-associated domain
MLSHFDEYGYLGVFLALLASGMGFPIPEELPVITAGIMVGHEDTHLRWYVMLPVCVLGVVVGDGSLYTIGRLWGTWFLSRPWVQRRILSPEQRAKIEKNFHDRGILVLLGARLLPGIRTPIFIMAGVLRVPFGRFVIADGLYAIPGVNLLFWLSYALTDQVMATYKLITHAVDQYRPLVMVSVLSAVAGALIQKYVFTRKVSTGEPPPAIINKPAEVLTHAVERAAERAAEVVAHVTHRHEHAAHEPKPAEPSPNGTAEVKADEPIVGSPGGTPDGHS